MKILDVNLLLYAPDSSSPRHDAARPWVEQTLRSEEVVGLPWTVLLAFLRLSTRAALFAEPLSPTEAMDVIDGWLALPTVVTPTPGARHARLLRALLAEAGSAGNPVPDAHLVALAIEHAAELCSCDGDFARFSGLRWVDPLR